MKNRKPMPKAAVLVLVIVAAILVAFAGYTMLIKPQKAKAKAIQAQITEKQATLDQYRNEAAAAKANVAPKIRVADVYRLARAMPSTEDMPDLLIELDDVAKAAGIQLNSISPGGQTGGNGFQLVPITIQFAGDYYSITDLLYRFRTLVAVRHGQLEATGRLFSVKSLTLSPSGTGLSASVNLETYIYGGSAAAPVTAVPATPPPAGTTTTPASTGAHAERGTP